MDTLLRYAGALFGTVAVLSFLVLPVVQKSFLWIGASRNGTWLIQTVFASSSLEGGLVGVALVAALLATGASGLLFLWNRFKHGSMCAQVALGLMLVLFLYLAIETGSTKVLTVGFWISLWAMVVMSILARLVSLPSGGGQVRSGRARAVSRSSAVAKAFRSSARKRGAAVGELPRREVVEEEEAKLG